MKEQRLCPSCEARVLLLTISGAVAGLSVACNNCGSRLTVSNSWKHLFVAFSVLAIVLSIAFSIKARSYGPHVVGIFAEFAFALIIARLAKPQKTFKKIWHGLALWSAFAIFVFVLAFAHGPIGTRHALASDAKLVQDLVGTWQVDRIPEKGGHISGFTTFSSDGTFVDAAHISVPKHAEFDVHLEGNWKVEDQYLIEMTTKSDFPPIAPGFTTRDRLMTVNA